MSDTRTDTPTGTDTSNEEDSWACASSVLPIGSARYETICARLEGLEPEGAIFARENGSAATGQ